MSKSNEEFHRSLPGSMKDELRKIRDNDPSFTSVSFYMSCLGAEGVIQLCALMEGNTSLLRLGLSQNRIGPEAGPSLAHLVETNQSLTELDIVGNPELTEKGVLPIIAALPFNTSIRQLDLGTCGMSDRSLQLLSSALRDNHSLTSLYIAGETNTFSDAGLAAFLSSVENHPSLRSISK